MDINEFLSCNRVDKIRSEIKVSDRLSDEAGNSYLFKIKALSMDEFQNCKSKALRNGKTDINSFKCSVVISGCVYPNFKESESLERAGVKTPEEYVKRCLLAGEIAHIAGEILKLSGFGKLDELGEGYGA